MKKACRLAIALAIALGLPGVQSAGAQSTLTMSSMVSPLHHLSTHVTQGWAIEVEKATAGRVKFQMLPKHPAAPPGTFDAVQGGLTDLSYTVASYTPGRHVLPLMAELPGTGATSEINSVAYSRIYWKHFHKLGEYNGVKLLGVFTHGPGQMYNTKRPINSMADLRGMKIRTGGGIAEAMATLLGASPFVKPAPESYELLKSGVADGTFFPAESVITFKLETVVKHATLIPGGFYNSAFSFFMNQNAWDKISKRDQDIIETLSGEYIARRAGKSWDNADRLGNEILRKSGVSIIEASPVLINEIQAAAAQVEQEWIKKASSARGIDATMVLREFREEIKRVAAGM